MEVAVHVDYFFFSFLIAFDRTIVTSFSSLFFLPLNVFPSLDSAKGVFFSFWVLTCRMLRIESRSASIFFVRDDFFFF